MINCKITGKLDILYEDHAHIPSDTDVFGYIRIGAHSYIGIKNLIGDVKIGRFCSIAPNVTMSLGVHPTEYISTHPFFYTNENGVGIERDISEKKHSPAIIGNDVWVGANVYIAKGVTIGSGSVVASNSSVVKDVEPYSIVGGSPAKLIRKRFTDEIVSDLMQLKWWNYDVDSFKGFAVNDPSTFIKQFKDSNPVKVKYKTMLQTASSLSEHGGFYMPNI